MRTLRTNPRTVAASATLAAPLAAVLATGCAGPGYADRGPSAYATAPQPVVAGQTVREVVHRDVVRVPERSTRVVDDPASEAARRRWIEEQYGRPRTYETEPAAETVRYVPRKEVVRERVIVVDREPRYWVPPVHFDLGYWRGGHRGHGHWNWGAHWRWPSWGW